MAVNEKLYVPEPSPTQEHAGIAQPLMLHPAIVNLRDYQGQLDRDGVCVAVSRQAVEETLAVTLELLEGAQAVIRARQQYAAWMNAGVARALLPYTESSLRKDAEAAFDQLVSAVATADGSASDRVTADAEPGTGRLGQSHNTTPENPHD